MKRFLLIVIILLIVAVQAIAQGHDNTSRCKYSKANVIWESDPECRACKAEQMKIVNDRKKKEQDAKDAYNRKKALEDKEEARQEAERKRLADERKKNTGTITINAPSSSNSTTKSSSVNTNSNTKDASYNKHMADYRKAIDAGNYGAAKEALQQANSLKRVNNYQSIDQSLGILNNAYGASAQYDNNQQARERAYNEAIENGMQALGDMAEAIRYNRQQRLKAEAEAKDRFWARKTENYYDEKTKSAAGLMYEKDEFLQTCLIDANQPDAVLKELYRLSYWNMFDLPQKIMWDNKSVYAGNNQIKLVENNNRQVLYNDLQYPYILPGNNGLMLITYTASATDGDRRSLVYDIKNKRAVSDWISVDFQHNGGEILGLSRDGTEFYYSRIGNLKKGTGPQIVAHNISSGTSRIMTIPQTSTTRFWHATKFINGRYAVAREHYWNFFSVTDVKTGETIYLPANNVDALAGLASNDPEEFLMLSFYEHPLYCMASFNDMLPYFNYDFLTKYPKLNAEEQAKLLTNIWDEKLVPAGKVKQFDALGQKNYRSTFTGFKSKVHTEQSGTQFKIFESRSYRNNDSKCINSCSTPKNFQYPNYIYYPFQGVHETHDMIIGKRIFLTLNNNFLSIRNITTKESKEFELGYYPIKILEFSEDYISILGVDEYAFPIVKIYDLDKLEGSVGM